MTQQDERLERLFAYTKFHIGMYTTLVTAAVGVFANDSLNKHYGAMIPCIKIAVVAFFVAGIFGGLVASSIPYKQDWDTFQRTDRPVQAPLD